MRTFLQSIYYRHAATNIELEGRHLVLLLLAGVCYVST